MMTLNGGSPLLKDGKVANRRIVKPHNVIKSPH